MLWVRMFKIRNGVDKVRHYRTEAAQRPLAARRGAGAAAGRNRMEGEMSDVSMGN